MIKILDACAMIAYLRGEPGAEIVEALLLDKSNQCLAHAVNLCEVYYDFLRAKDEASALGAIADLNSAGVIARDDMDTQFWQAAGTHKATIKKISLADCFALALANRMQAELVTSDHHEFDAVAEKGYCSVLFIR
jgi:PIN domain nuclease of toxin-antitoxin system